MGSQRVGYTELLHFTSLRTMLAIIPVFMKRIIYIFIYIFIQSSETISFGYRS